MPALSGGPWPHLGGFASGRELLPQQLEQLDHRHERPRIFRKLPRAFRCGKRLAVIELPDVDGMIDGGFELKRGL